MKFSAFIKSEAPEGSAALAITIDGACRGILEYDYKYKYTGVISLALRTG